MGGGDCRCRGAGTSGRVLRPRKRGRPGKEAPAGSPGEVGPESPLFHPRIRGGAGHCQGSEKTAKALPPILPFWMLTALEDAGGGTRLGGPLAAASGPAPRGTLLPGLLGPWGSLSSGLAVSPRSRRGKTPRASALWGVVQAWAPYEGCRESPRETGRGLFLQPPHGPRSSSCRHPAWKPWCTGGRGSPRDSSTGPKG